MNPGSGEKHKKSDNFGFLENEFDKGLVKSHWLWTTECYIIGNNKISNMNIDFPQNLQLLATTFIKNSYCIVWPLPPTYRLGLPVFLHVNLSYSIRLLSL